MARSTFLIQMAVSCWMSRNPMRWVSINLANFVYCRHCGVFVAVLFETGDRTFGSVNSRCIGGDIKFGDFQTVSPQKLDAQQKKERWAKVMIPDVQVRLHSPDAR